MWHIQFFQLLLWNNQEMSLSKIMKVIAMKQPRKLSNQESQRFENFRIQAPKSKGCKHTCES